MGLADQFRLLPTRANGHPAFALFVEGTEGGWRTHSLQMPESDGELISGLTLFMGPLGPTLFPAFGLPDVSRMYPHVTSSRYTVGVVNPRKATS
jgi:hypothetical protein